MFDLYRRSVELETALQQELADIRASSHIVSITPAVMLNAERELRERMERKLQFEFRRELDTQIEILSAALLKAKLARSREMRKLNYRTRFRARSGPHSAAFYDVVLQKLDGKRHTAIQRAHAKVVELRAKLTLLRKRKNNAKKIITYGTLDNSLYLD